MSVFIHIFGEHMGNADAFEVLLKPVNQRLKTAKTRVTIRRKRDALYLRATLPPKPGSRRVKPYRQELPVGVPATKLGLKQAEAEAKLLGGLLVTKQFSWPKWLGKKPPAEQLVGELVQGFKAEYMGTHNLTEETWKQHWQVVYDSLDQDSLLNATEILAKVFKLPKDSRKRREYCLKFQKLADFAGIPIELKPYQGTYSSTKPQNARDLPTDAQVNEWREKIPDPAWRCFYGVVATFGLRPHEFWYCRFIDDLTLYVIKGKTGPRTVQALYPEWVQQWNLHDLQRPNVAGGVWQQLEVPPKGFRVYGERASTQFSRYDLPFSPYDLRHAWAIRASITFRLPDTIAAQMMGHSVSVHNRTYHRWLSQAKSDEVYRAAIKDGPKAP